MAFAIVSAVCGQHFYKDIWDAEIDSELSRFVVPDNREDGCAVAVMNGADVWWYNIFLCLSGSIICHITGPRQYSRDDLKISVQ